MKVFVTQPVAESALARLRQAADVECNPDASKPIAKEALREAVRRNDLLFCLLHDRVDREVIAANPHLRAINSMAVTPDNIDLSEATARRIPVTVIPAMVGEATADICFALILAVARRIVEGDRVVRQGMFPGSQSSYLAGGGVCGKCDRCQHGKCKRRKKSTMQAHGVAFLFGRRGCVASHDLNDQFDLLRRA